MGEDKKKQLTQLLAFVKDLYDNPDYKDFAAGIQAIVLDDKDFLKDLQDKVFHGDPEALHRIEAYLSLDFQIDSREIPDFAAIKDASVRDRLLADHREMLRYEFGTRSHKIDFAEFCRYANLQVEMLVNYYYEKKYNSDIEAIKNAIREGNYNEKEDKYYYDPNPKTKKVSDIGLGFKLGALQEPFSWEYNDIQIYRNVMNVRNQQSHRSLFVNRDLIREVENKLKKEGGWNEKYNREDYQKSKDILDYATRNDYHFQLWLDEQPFEDVRSAISRLAEKVATAL